MADLKMSIFQNGALKYFQVVTTPVPSDFDGLPYNRLGTHRIQQKK